jgi:hypothetical protein
MIAGMGRSWGLLGALVVAAACSGPAATATATEGDGGEDAPGSGSSGGQQIEGGALRNGSSASPLGHGDMLGDGGADAGLDAGSTQPKHDGPWTIAVPGGLPQVVTQGGPTLTAPLIQAITFSDYDLTTYVDDFVSKIGATSYWQQVVSEYGIGSATAAAPVHVPSAAPTNVDDSQIQTWLANEIANNPAYIQPSAQSLYVLFYPYATNITYQSLQSCFTMGAYHNSILVGGVAVAYAVVPECVENGKSTLQTTTAAASHEIVECATDPFPYTSLTAYGGLDGDHLFFSVIVGGGEVADLCAQWPSSLFVPDGIPYMVQRTWSNAAALAGFDPCRPELPGEIYFNAVPDLADAVTISSQGQTYPTKGVHIPLGSTRTIDVHLYSEGDIGPWTVQAANTPPYSANLQFVWDQTTGQNGDTLHLTITAQGVDQAYSGEPFVLSSTQGNTTNYWIGYVGN